MNTTKAHWHPSSRINSKLYYSVASLGVIPDGFELMDENWTTKLAMIQEYDGRRFDINVNLEETGSENMRRE
jgi:hypothetical protein